MFCGLPLLMEWNHIPTSTPVSCQIFFILPSNCILGQKRAAILDRLLFLLMVSVLTTFLALFWSIMSSLLLPGDPGRAWSPGTSADFVCYQSDSMCSFLGFLVAVRVRTSVCQRNWGMWLIWLTGVPGAYPVCSKEVSWLLGLWCSVGAEMLTVPPTHCTPVCWVHLAASAGHSDDRMVELCLSLSSSSDSLVLTWFVIVRLSSSILQSVLFVSGSFQLLSICVSGEVLMFVWYLGDFSPKKPCFQDWFLLSTCILLVQSMPVNLCKLIAPALVIPVGCLGCCWDELWFLKHVTESSFLLLSVMILAVAVMLSSLLLIGCVFSSFTSLLFFVISGCCSSWCYSVPLLLIGHCWLFASWKNPLSSLALLCWQQRLCWY